MMCQTQACKTWVIPIKSWNKDEIFPVKTKIRFLWTKFFANIICVWQKLPHSYSEKNNFYNLNKWDNIWLTKDSKKGESQLLAPLWPSFITWKSLFSAHNSHGWLGLIFSYCHSYPNITFHVDWTFRLNVEVM